MDFILADVSLFNCQLIGIYALNTSETAVTVMSQFFFSIQHKLTQHAQVSSRFLHSKFRYLINSFILGIIGMQLRTLLLLHPILISGLTSTQAEVKQRWTDFLLQFLPLIFSETMKFLIRECLRPSLKLSVLLL